MRRTRRLRPRPRRRAARALRAARAPAPRPGVGRNRRLRRQPPDRAARHGPGRAGIQRAEAQRPARPAGDRAHPLLDHRLGPVVERAADRPARPCSHGGARAQRQSGERGRAARGTGGRRCQARVELGHGADRRADRQRPRAAGGRGRKRDGQAGGRLLGDRARRGQADRLPRPARLPAAGARAALGRLGGRLRDVRARSRRRRVRARARPRRTGGRRRGRPRSAPGRSDGGRRALHLRVLLPRPPGHPARGHRGARRQGADGRAAGRGGARPRPTSSCPSPTRGRRRRSASPARPASRSARD